jgi:D-alanine-D-alanine ligase
MRVAIVHDAVGESDAPDARDAIVQADAVARALGELGHTVCRIACSLNLLAVTSELRSRRVDLVFNLVESIGGQGRLIHLLPFCLDALPLPYTGAPAEAVMLTSSKTMAKAWMAAGAIPTPAWVGPWPGTDGRGDEAVCGRGSWIVKSVWEHASIGLGPQSLVRDAGPAEIFGRLEPRAAELGGACFAEHFIAGREFNLSLLAHPDGPQVLPPAEIVFEGYTAEMPRIVGYRAKWDPSAFEYHHTPRRFACDPSDAGLLTRLAALALRCWDHFGLRGYARVDFRVDDAGAPWVLEINANPCLAPDAGFAAALAQAGIPYADAVGRIVAASLPPA